MQHLMRHILPLIVERTVKSIERMYVVNFGYVESNSTFFCSCEDALLLVTQVSNSLN